MAAEFTVSVRLRGSILPPSSSDSEEGEEVRLYVESVLRKLVEEHPCIDTAAYNMVRLTNWDGDEELPYPGPSEYKNIDAGITY